MSRQDTGTENSIGPRTWNFDIVFGISIVVILLLAIVLPVLHQSLKKAAAEYVQAAVENADIRSLSQVQVSDAISNADIGGKVQEAVSDANIQALVQGAVWDADIGGTVRLELNEVLKPAVRDVLGQLYEKASAVPAPEEEALLVPAPAPASEPKSTPSIDVEE